ncbi:MAG: hypothetical protein ACUVXB_01820 [Bryobacteraceae bacterium]
MTVFLLCWALVVVACPLCPDGAQGPHDCCHKSQSQTTPCGHTQTSQPDQQPCPGGHLLYADYGKAQTDAGIAAASADAGPLRTVRICPAQMPETELEPAFEPGHSPPPLFLMNSILRI